MEMNCALEGANRLRVAQVIGSYGGGGSQRQAYNLIVGLGEQGAVSYGIALRHVGDYALSGDRRIQVVGLNARRGKPVGLLSAMIRMRRVVRRWDLDVIHVQGLQSLPFVMLATLGMNKAPKLLFTWHNSESVLEQTGWRRKVLLWSLRRCDAVLGSSSKVARLLETRSGLKHVGVFHGGVPIRPPSRSDVEPCPCVLWIGRVVPGKDPAALIRAASALKGAGLRFRVCMLGGAHQHSSYLDEMRALIAQMHVEDVVEAPGYADARVLADLLAKASIGVQTSLAEGLSMAVLEQMMAGIALVATDVGDTRQAVLHEKTGLLIPPKDEPALVECLRRLITNERLRAALGQAAREHALANFSLRAMSRRALEAYRQALGSR